MTNAPARSATTLDARLAHALRKAYARDDFRLQGVATAIVQALVTRGLAVTMPCGSRERHALSPAGIRRATELTREALICHGQTPALAISVGDGPEVTQAKIAWCDRLVDFLAGTTGVQETTLVVYLPATGHVGPGRRVRVERCGPTKFLLQVNPPRTLIRRGTDDRPCHDRDLPSREPVSREPTEDENHE